MSTLNIIFIIVCLIDVFVYAKLPFPERTRFSFFRHLPLGGFWVWFKLNRKAKSVEGDKNGIE